MKVYFTDRFDVDPDVLEEFGAFNVSLINDLPLFIHPFLLFTSEKEKYQQLHDDNLTFLRNQSVGGNVDGGRGKCTRRVARFCWHFLARVDFAAKFRLA